MQSLLARQSDAHANIKTHGVSSEDPLNEAYSAIEPIRTRSDVLTDAKVVNIAGFLHKLLIVVPIIVIQLSDVKVTCFPSNAEKT
jgi:hypothetical protein